MIRNIVIKNYKIFREFELELNPDFNIIVGNNEVGKSTVLEAINLALTKRLNGRFIEQELTPYIFNAEVANDYIASINKGAPVLPPPIVIELYFEEDERLAPLRGSNNSKGDSCIGIKLEIVFDEDFKEEYRSLLEDERKPDMIPSEYYKCQWYSFAYYAITARSLPIRPAYIDATAIRLQSGTDYYMQDIIRTSLNPKQRACLNVDYRLLKEHFAESKAIIEMNEKLTQKTGAITDKNLSLSIDISQRANWEANLVPHLDKLPFQLVGAGEQNTLKVLLALERKEDETNIVLIEEPENHLSFSSMNKLITRIKNKCKDRQIIMTTHSAYVLNKLGLEHLLLISKKGRTTLRDLPKDTQEYFRRLSGYDTLRLVLAKKAILVEGPSDELVVQKAYRQANNNNLPIEDGIDVINVHGLSFCRFLDIAVELGISVVVLTDNDGNYQRKVLDKYTAYKKYPNIKICASNDNNLTTLESQLVNSIGLTKINAVLDRDFADEQLAIDHMLNNKTECALKIFNCASELNFPQYIQDAVKQ